MLDKLKHWALAASIPVLLSVASVTAYHYWWKHKHHQMLSHRAEIAFRTESKLAFPLLALADENRTGRDWIDWLNVLKNFSEVGSPVFFGWLAYKADERRRFYAEKVGEKK